METIGGVFDRDWNRGDVLAGALLAAGLGLAGFGGVVHLVAAARVRSGTCGACSLFLWHPLFVGAPLLFGSVLVLAAASLFHRRRCRPGS